MVETGLARAVQLAREIEPSAGLLIAGLALAAYKQGAFALSAQLLIAIPLVVGVVLAPSLPVVTRRDLPVVVTAAALGAWAVIDGVMTGHLLAGIRYFLLIAAVLILAAVCRQLPDLARRTVVNGLLMMGCAVAALGWFGVVAHFAPWGFGSGRLWRASSSLTYPNAAAVMLAMVALVCLALRHRDPAARWLGHVATILIAGLVATLSRAGLGGFAIGLGLLSVGIGVRSLCRAAMGPLLGALVAAAGLLPSVIAPDPTLVTTVLAVAGAVAGLALGGHVPANRFTLGIFVAGVVAVVMPLSGRFATRLTLDSPDRWGSYRAAWDVFQQHPISGAGPGINELVLARATGGITVFRFAHNEYLQVLAELGMVGGLLLAAFVVVVIVRLWRDRAGGVAGALAAFVALVFHAGFDFVWHIPAIPLLAAAFAGTAMTRTESITTKRKVTE